MIRIYDTRIDFTIEAENAHEADAILERVTLTDPAHPDQEIALDTGDGIEDLDDGEYDARVNFSLRMHSDETDDRRAEAAARAYLDTLVLEDPETGKEYGFDTSEAIDSDYEIEDADAA